MFKSLRTKLTVLYAGVFGVALTAVAALSYAMIAQNAARQVRLELQANSEVFDRIWTLRQGQLRDTAEILGRDFGFREAVATRDDITIRSALDNLRRRLDIEHAFMVGLDGAVVGVDRLSPGELESLWLTLDSGARASGVLMMDGRPLQAVSAPILAPDPIGWIVFATELDDAHLDSFEALAAIPIESAVFTRPQAARAWLSSSGDLSPQDISRIGAGLDHLVGQPDLGEPRRLRASGGDFIVQVKQVQTFDGGGEAVLLLRYNVALAMQPYRPLFAAIIGAGALGMVFVAFASWALARRLTRPIAALDAAARALQHGQRTEAPVETADEIGRLAQSFNVMAHEIEAREERITHMALHDPGTDLPNRRALERSIETTRREQAFVLAFAIERFAAIRSAIGYGLATRLAGQVGARLRTAAQGAAIGQLTADTIAVIVENTDSAAALALADHLRAQIDGAVSLGEVSVDVSSRAGLAPIARSSDASPLDEALIAIDQARKAQRGCVLFDARAYGDPKRNLSLMSEMLNGINRGHLSLHYQPKLDLRSGEIGGVEALVRWTHPTRGRIAPDLFVIMAEETGHIGTLTEWTLIEAAAACRRLRADGHALLVSINLSGRLISDDAFTDMVLTLVEDSEAALCLEITETAAMDDADAAWRNIDRYAAAGIKIAIDDYGAGLSSLDYLKRIRADELKLDQSFVRNLCTDARDALLVKSTIDLAHGLGMKITAEGVESEEALAMLKDMGCDTVQGYYVGRPMPLSALLEVLNGSGARALEAAVARRAKAP